MEIIILICVFALFMISFARDDCTARYHYWQPFYGTIPAKTFNAGVDTNGEIKYVGRIVSPGERTWSAPTTFSATNMWSYFGWEGESNDRITKFIELLMVEPIRPGFGWARVSKKRELYNLEDNCCFVEGGYGYKDGKRYVAYVARTHDSGGYYIGGLYLPDWNNKDAMHYMKGWESKYIEKDYAILAYDCCTNQYCSSHQTIVCCKKKRNDFKREAVDYTNNTETEDGIDISWRKPTISLVDGNMSTIVF